MVTFCILLYSVASSGQVCKTYINDTDPTIPDEAGEIEWCTSTCQPRPVCDEVRLTFNFTTGDDGPIDNIGIRLYVNDDFVLTENPDGFVAAGTEPLNGGADLLNIYTKDNFSYSSSTGKVTFEIVFNVPTFITTINNQQMWLEITVDDVVELTDFLAPCYFTTDGVSLGSDGETNSLLQLINDLSLPNSSASQTTAQEWVVSGTLLIDTDYWLPGSQIYLSEGAKVIIQDGHDLFLVSTSQARTIVQGCEKMWDAIEVLPGGGLHIEGAGTLRDAIVQDGDNGIILHDRSLLSLNQATLLNNYRNIQTPVDFSPKSFVITINGVNQITSDDDLKAPRTGYLPYSGMSLFGADGVNIIGTSDTNTIEFSGLARGILAFRSSLEIEKMKFFNIHDDPATGVSSTEGVAVRAVGLGVYRRLFYTGFDHASIFDVRDCDVGFIADDMRFSVEETRITDVEKGVLVKRSDQRSIDIKNNDITARDIGIELLHNMPTNLDMEANTINIDDDLASGNSATGIGIRGEENSTSTFGYYRIRDNEINVDNAETGIWFESGKWAIIKENTIDLLDNSRETYFGIDVQGSVNPIAKCNLVLGNATESNWRSAIGMNTVGINDGIYYCNEIEDTDIGFNFLGVEDGTYFAGNDINEHRLGLHIESGAYIGEQNHEGNLWLGSAYGSPGVGGLNGNFGGYNASNPFLSQFRVDQQENTGYNTSVNIPNWFIVQNDPAASYSCTTSSCENGPGAEFVNEEPDEIDVLDYAIARNDLSPGTCDTAVNWTAQRHLYRRLMAKPSLYASDTLLQAFVDTAAANTVGDFHDIERDIIRLYEVDSLTDAELESQLTTIEADLAQLYTIDSTLLGSLSPGQKTALKAQRDSVATDLKAVQVAHDSIWGLLDSLRLLEVQGLLTANAAINAQTDPEVNEQTVNDIFLRTVASGVDTFTTQQVTDLATIAAQCAPCGGDAVFRARAIYALHDASARFADAVPCVGTRSAGQARSLEKVVDWSVYPNPANVSVTIEIGGNPDIEHRNLSVINLTGQKILSKDLPSNAVRHTVDTSELASGIYFFKLMEDGRPVQSKRIFILK